MTTTWKIFDTKSETSNGLITKVFYGCTVRLGNSVDRKVGQLELTGDTTSKTFIPFSELTQDIVMKWVKDSIGTEQVSLIETTLQDNVGRSNATVYINATRQRLT